MGHDPVGGCEDDVSKLSGGQQVNDPLFDFVVGTIESWRDDAAFVESSVEFYDDFVGAVIVDDFEFSNVPVLLHAEEEFDNDLGGGANEDLTATALFRVGNGLETIGENGHANHLEERWKEEGSSGGETKEATRKVRNALIYYRYNSTPLELCCALQSLH